VRVAVLSDVHGQADALEAVMAAAVDADVDQLWSLGDMVGGGPDAARVATLVRSYCAVALIGNHDYGATGAVDPAVFPGASAPRSLELAAEQLSESGDLEWLRSLKPAARRRGIQCWHGSPRNAVREYVGPANAAACLARQRAPLGLVGHTHVPDAWRARPEASVERVRVAPGRALDVGEGKWLLNPGAVGAPVVADGDWWAAMAAHAAAGAWWLELDLDARVATWQRAPFDPEPARRRARALGIEQR
jgi:predicted phosphodiesterase